MQFHSTNYARELCNGRLSLIALFLDYKVDLPQNMSAHSAFSAKAGDTTTSDLVSVVFCSVKNRFLDLVYSAVIFFSTVLYCLQN